MEGAGQILTMTAFFGFGAFLLPDGLAHMTPQAVILAICFLTFVRMVPIWLSLTGSGLPISEKLFLGWFGPRGLASILFTLIIMDEFDFPTENELLACVSMTVFLSVFLHGLSANPARAAHREARVMGLETFEQSGNVWHPKAHRAEGSWRIEARDGELLFRLGTDFHTDWGPDVKLYMVTQSVEEIGIRDQLGDSGTPIGLIQAFEGAQDYPLPEVHHFGDFHAIMLHCQRYSAVWCGIAINIQSNKEE